MTKLRYLLKPRRLILQRKSIIFGKSYQLWLRISRLIDQPQEWFTTLWKALVVRIPKSMKSISGVACEPSNSPSKLVRFSEIWWSSSVSLTLGSCWRCKHTWERLWWWWRDNSLKGCDDELCLFICLGAWMVYVTKDGMGGGGGRTIFLLLKQMNYFGPKCFKLRGCFIFCLKFLKPCIVFSQT